MLQSNYYTLKHSKTIKAQRVQLLEDQIKELKAYHARARLAKRPIIQRLITGYEILHEKITARLDGIQA